jgi:hypothetical protein
MTVIDYTECPNPSCKKLAEIDDGLIREKVTYLEKKQRIATKKMIRKIIPLGINYRVVFPWKSDSFHNALICQHCGYYKKVWGWTNQLIRKYKDKIKEIYIITIPRKTFFLPRDEFVDTAVAHEPTHTLTWEDEHGRKFYFKYRDNRKIVFRKFSRFINAKNTLPIKFRKGEGHKIYLSNYKDEYEEEQKKLSLLKMRKKTRNKHQKKSAIIS